MARTKLFINQGPPKLQGIPKLRHKEEKKQMIKLCMKKLKTIEDTESLLCKSVLIVNTIRKIRKFNQEYNLELISSYMSGNTEEEEILDPEEEWRTETGQDLDNMASKQYGEDL